MGANSGACGGCPPKLGKNVSVLSFGEVGKNSELRPGINSKFGFEPNEV